MIKDIFFKRFACRTAIGFIRRRWFYFIPAAVFLLFFILLSPYIFRPWTRYPEELRADLAWRLFVSSFDGVCRELCLAQRQEAAGIWRQYGKDNPDFLYKRTNEVLLHGSENLKKATIRILAADSPADSLVPVLNDFILDGSTNKEDKMLVLRLRPDVFLDEEKLSSLRAVAADVNLPAGERSEAFAVLASFPNVDNFILAKKVFLSGAEQELEESVFSALSLWPEEFADWSAEEQAILARDIRNSTFGKSRWRRIWLIAGSRFPDLGLLSGLANDASLDAITRGLAAQAVRAFGRENIITPEPTAAEWQSFYENI